MSEPFRGALPQAKNVAEQVCNQVAAGVRKLTGDRSLTFWLQLLDVNVSFRVALYKNYKLQVAAPV